MTFTPQTATDYNNSVLIYSDDPDESTVEIPLTGTGIAPVIDVSPVEYDFGTLYIGCDSEQAFTISNIGNADLQVTGFDFNTGSSDYVEPGRSGEVVPIRDAQAIADAILKWADIVMASDEPPLRRIDADRLSCDAFERRFPAHLEKLELLPRSSV